MLISRDSAAEKGNVVTGKKMKIANLCPLAVRLLPSFSAQVQLSRRPFELDVSRLVLLTWLFRFPSTCDAFRSAKRKTKDVSSLDCLAFLNSTDAA